MHSFLIVSKNRQNAIDYAVGECKKNQIDKFDIDILTFEKAVGIEEVRNVQKKLYLKPLKSRTKAVVIDTSYGLTIEAQNALLKILEEPPANTIIYITSANKELLLPTILSRCKIIDLKQEIQTLSKQELLSTKDILVYLQSKEIGGKLKLAQDLAKNKDDVIPWLEKMIIVAREGLIMQIMKDDKSDILPSSFWGAASNAATPESPTTMTDSGQDGYQTVTRQARMTDFQIISKYVNILTSLQKTYTVLKTTNVNPRLALENLFLNI